MRIEQPAAALPSLLVAGQRRRRSAQSMHRIEKAEAEQRVLVADDEAVVRLAGNAQPLELRHLAPDRVIDAGMVVVVALRPHAVEDGRLDEADRTRLVVLRIVVQHAVQTQHRVQVTAVHDVLALDRVGPGLPQLLEVGVEARPRPAGLAPVVPHLAPHHLADQSIEHQLGGARRRIQVVICGQSHRIGHERQLIAVGVQPLLSRVPAAHVPPLAVGHRGQVLRVLQVAHLLAVKRVHRDGRTRRDPRGRCPCALPESPACERAAGGQAKAQRRTSCQLHVHLTGYASRAPASVHPSGR